jgi:hypothetical protein
LTKTPFVFVGHAVSKMYICSNGLVLFDEPSKEFDATKPHDLSQGSFRGRSPSLALTVDMLIERSTLIISVVTGTLVRSKLLRRTGARS